MNISTFMKAAIYTLFFISGFTGLVYEVTWTRMLTTVFGSTTYAITSVLSAFMGGLAIGSFVIGRYIERKKNPILVYAFLEIGIGITALLTPIIFKILDNIYPFIYEYTTSYTWLLILTKVVLSLLILFVPTFLMGGTLPVLCKLFINRPKESGKQVGILYAINTIGAAIGCFIAGFFLIELFGIAKTIQLVAAVNFLLAIAFFLLNIYYKLIKADIETTNIENIKKTVSDSDSHIKLQPFYSILVLIGFALAGFVSLSYEVLWTRLLIFKLKMTVYSFSVMLTTFLMGIGIGSIVVLIFEKYNLIKNHSKAFGVVVSFIGLMGLATIFLFGQIDSIPIFDMIGFFKSSISWKKLIFTEILLAGMIMILPTILMGMTFPLVSRIFTHNIKIVGKTIGGIYSINTIGSILGSCVTGFILVKFLGTQKSIFLISLIALTVGTTIVLLNQRGINKSKNSKSFPIIFSTIAWSIAVGLILWLPKDILFKYYNIYEEQFTKGTQIIYANEGIECITTVHKYPGGFKGISTSSVNVAGTHYTSRTIQKQLAHVPLLLHHNPKEILQVGFGSGETSHLVTTYDIEQLDLVEISREVIETSTKFFQEINKDVANHPRFNPIIMDGANYIYLTKKKYDLIINDSSGPMFTGCSALYSKDYFENAKKILKPNGIMTCWFPIAEGENFKIPIKTFHSVFPYVSVWLAMTHLNKHVLVVGSLHKIEIDTKDFLTRFKQYAQNDLKSVDLDNPIFFLDAYQMDETVLDNLLDSTPIHTLNHPILEFTERKRDAVQNIAALRIITENNISMIPYLKNSKNIYINGKNILKSLESTRDATKLVMNGYIRVVGSGEYQPKYDSEFKEALKIEPNHPGAIHFFFKMFDIHLNLAYNYAKNQNQKYAAYCYKLAFKEINFYISLKPDAAKAYHNRGLIYLNGSDYLGLKRNESLEKAREDFFKVQTLNPKYAMENDIRAFIDRINNLLKRGEQVAD
jgi:spermidine synthase